MLMYVLLSTLAPMQRMSFEDDPVLVHLNGFSGEPHAYRHALLMDRRILLLILFMKWTHNFEEDNRFDKLRALPSWNFKTKNTFDVHS